MGINPVIDIFFLPGMMCDRRIWEPVWQNIQLKTQDIPLAAHFFDCYCDTPTSMADFARAVLKKYRGGKAIFAGFSMGGHIAFEIFRQVPNSIDGLFLCNTSADIDTASRRIEREKLLAIPENTDTVTFCGLTRAVWPNFVAEHNLQEQKMFELVQDMAMAHGIISAKHQAKALLDRVNSHTTMKALGRAQIPVTICGSTADRITSWAHSQNMAQSHGNATLLSLNSGHLGPLEDPSTVSQALLNLAHQIA